MTFFGIPIRSAATVLPDWFNSLRSAGVNLENWLGSSFLSETTVEIENDTGPADVTDLVFDSTEVRSVQVAYQIRRKTDSSENIFSGRMTLMHKSGTWLDPAVEIGAGDETGVTFSITSDGQVQYTSDDMSGDNYIGEIRFKATTFGV